MANESVESRLSRLEERVRVHSDRIDKVEDNSKSLTRLSTLVELQMEVNKEQQEQIKEQNKTLIGINENLTGLNKGLQDVNNRVTEIENQQNDKKIDLVVLVKDIVFKVVPTLIGAWLIFKFGLK